MNDSRRSSSRAKRAPSRLDSGGDEMGVQQAIRRSLLDQKRIVRDIPEARVFRPTIEECSDFLGYVAKIQDIGNEEGMIKIIPPEGWRPSTIELQVTNPFETKRQVLNHLQEGQPFDDGERYNQATYKDYADALREQWLARHPALKDRLDELLAQNLDSEEAAKILEDQFWRLVECVDSEEYSVDYANDLNTLQYGSGFPPGDPRSFNMNQLVAHEQSVLRKLDLSIEGVTYPWLYFGAMFATFCWHVEDHFLYAINYMHAGEPKTWYGAPESSAKRLEECIVLNAPQRFTEERDLMHHMTTLVPPSLLMEAGVKVCHTVQREGELILTFPRAYHCGFSHGWNCAEAANFGVMDWFPRGREAVVKYSKGPGRRPPVFSHDKLVWEWCQEAVNAAASLATLTAGDATAPRTKVEFSAPPPGPATAPGQVASPAAGDGAVNNGGGDGGGPAPTPSTSPSPPPPETAAASGPSTAAPSALDAQGDTVMDGVREGGASQDPSDLPGGDAGPLPDAGGPGPSGPPSREGSAARGIAVTFTSLLEDPSIEGELMPEPFSSRNLRTLRDELEASVTPELRLRSALRKAGVREVYRQAGPVPMGDDGYELPTCSVCGCMSFFAYASCSCRPDKVRCLEHAQAGCECEVDRLAMYVRVNDFRLHQTKSVLRSLAEQSQARNGCLISRATIAAAAKLGTVERTIPGAAAATGAKRAAVAAPAAPPAKRVFIGPGALPGGGPAAFPDAPPFPLSDVHAHISTGSAPVKQDPEAVVSRDPRRASSPGWLPARPSQSAAAAGRRCEICIRQKKGHCGTDKAIVGCLVRKAAAAAAHGGRQEPAAARPPAPPRPKTERIGRCEACKRQKKAGCGTESAIPACTRRPSRAAPVQRAEHPAGAPEIGGCLLQPLPQLEPTGGGSPTGAAAAKASSAAVAATEKRCEVCTRQKRAGCGTPSATHACLRRPDPVAPTTDGVSRPGSGGSSSSDIAAAAGPPRTRCAMCVRQKKGHCGTDAAIATCLRRKRAPVFGAVPIRSPSPSEGSDPDAERESGLDAPVAPAEPSFAARPPFPGIDEGRGGVFNDDEMEEAAWEASVLPVPVLPALVDAVPVSMPTPSVPKAEAEEEPPPNPAADAAADGEKAAVESLMTFWQSQEPGAGVGLAVGRPGGVKGEAPGGQKRKKEKGIVCRACGEDDGPMRQCLSCDCWYHTRGGCMTFVYGVDKEAPVLCENCMGNQ